MQPESSGQEKAQLEDDRDDIEEENEELPILSPPSALLSRETATASALSGSGESSSHCSRYGPPTRDPPENLTVTEESLGCLSHCGCDGGGGRKGSLALSHPSEKSSTDWTAPPLLPAVAGQMTVMLLPV